MATMQLDDLPGFRRRFVVVPGPDSVRSDVEDDYHCMGVTVHHDGSLATRVEAQMTRVPWTTCPGAPAVLSATFADVPLDAFPARGAKSANCTHLHDLTLLAAAHAHDDAALVYDILVSDPVDGRNSAELRRDGVPAMRWELAGFRIVAPEELAGVSLMELNPWIRTLDAQAQEQARLLRWGTILAHGRTRSSTTFDKADLPRGQCYTFQPEVAVDAEHIAGSVRDFSGAAGLPLAIRALSGSNDLAVG